MRNNQKLNRWLLATLMLVAAMVVPSVAWADITPSKPSVGNGSSENPYQISTAAELYWFAALVNGTLTDGTVQNAAACAKLTANITVNSGVLNADGTLSSNSSSFTQWAPIGYYQNSDIHNLYTGTFDGNGKTVSGLYVNDGNASCVGLFGFNGGTVKSVGVVDSYFSGNHNIGSICGWNYTGTIFNCYHWGTVVGNDIAGGICGNNYCSTIANCYCSGSVSVTGSTSFYVGGVCGFHVDAVIENSYFNKDKCAEGIKGYYSVSLALGDMSKTTAQFQSGEVACLLAEGCTVEGQLVTDDYFLEGGDYDGSEWGQTLGTDSYPVIGGKEVFYGNINCQTDEEGYSNSSTPHNYNNGFCTRCDDCQPAEYVDENHHPELLPEYRDYYAIENAGQLYWFANRVNNDEYNGIDAVLTNHITVNSGVIDSNGALASDTSEFRPWTPIGWRNDGGTQRVLYNGIFDGNNYYINGLYFNDESTDNVGLLGYAMGTVRNLGIIGSYFKGGNNVGSMYGYGIARVINCFSFNCQVHGNTCVGGMCGRSYGDVSILCNSYLTGTVSGTTNVGSMCGLCEQESAIVANCYYDKEKCAMGAIGGSDVAGKAEGKTLAEFQSGKIAYLLSQGCTVGGEAYEGSHWGQWLILLDYPALGSLKVYYGYDTCDENAGMVYTNHKATDKRPGHSFDEHGFCKACTTGYQPAEVVSASHHAELVETHEGYYAIENGGQLCWFDRLVDEDNTVNGVLTADVFVNTGDVQGYDGKSEVTWRTWSPIGYEYAGKFDGNGHAVSGLFINNGKLDNGGLFAILTSEATVSNVTVENFYMNSGNFSGGVCGINHGTIVNCLSEGKICGNYGIAGICGKNNGRVEDCVSSTSVGTNGYTTQYLGGMIGDNYGTLINCTFKGTVIGDRSVGGVASRNYGTITNCKTSINGSVYGTKYVGGVSGYNCEAGVITGCKNAAPVFTTSNDGEDCVGGVCGYNLNKIEYCENTGNLNGVEMVGGVCGYNKGTLSYCKSKSTDYIIGQYDVGGVCGKNDTEGKIDFCSNSGLIEGDGPTVNDNSYRIGGVCGTNDGSITGSFNTGEITGSLHVGGLCGSNNADITHCYNRGLVSGNNIVGGLCGSNIQSVTHCFSAREVESGNVRVGSLCGNNGGTFSNCYYDNTVSDAAGIYNATDEEGKVVGRPTTLFRSGEVAYLLAQGTDGSVWGQQLGTDTYPVLGSSYKVVKAAQDGTNGNYWATFSNQEADVELCVPSGQSLTVYNAVVKEGKLTLYERNDAQVAMGEGVLLQVQAEYLNAKANETHELTPVDDAGNNLVATPATAQTLTADAGYKLYRLTYNNAGDKSGLGFYLGVVGSVKDGSKLKATPGKAYLKVAATEASNAQAFIFPEGGEVTAIEGITFGGGQVSGTAGEDIYDLSGRKVSRAAHGLYIRNGKKVIIK